MAEGLPPPEVYLDPSFNANSLKVAQLRGLLLSHQIPHPSSALKPTLLQLFHQHVLDRREELMEEVEERLSVVASEEGIEVMDGNGEVAESGTGRKKKGKKVEEVVVMQPPRRITRRSVSTTPAPITSSTQPTDLLTPTPAPSKLKKSKPKPTPSSQSQTQADTTSPSEPQIRPKPKPRRSTIKPTTNSTTKNIHQIEEEKDSITSSTSSLSSPSSDDELVTKPIKGPVTPRQQQQSGSVEDESGFSDYNPFQSGGEGKGKSGEKVVGRRRTVGGAGTGSRSSLGGSPSPSIDTTTTPTHAPVPRKSNLRNESRMSTPGGFGGGAGSGSGSGSGSGAGARSGLGPTSESGSGSGLPPAPSIGTGTPARKTVSSGSPNKVDFEPGAGVKGSPTSSSLRKIGPERSALRSPVKDWKVVEDQQEQEQDDGYEGVDEQEERQEDQAVTELEMEAALEGGAPSLDSTPIKESGLTLSRLAITLPFIALSLFSLYCLLDHQSLSREIGFCDTASTTNALTRQHQLRLQRDSDCELTMQRAIEQKKVLPVCDASAWYHPTACAPCPEFASCAIGKLVECTEERVLSSHPLGFLNNLLNGAPYLGPVAFPPTCERNMTEDNMVINYAMGIEAYLAKEKGRRICEEGWAVDPEKRNGMDAVKYGVDEESLYRSFWDVGRFGETGIKRILRSALDDLADHEEVFKQFGPGGKPYYAARRALIPFKCRARMSIVHSVLKHRQGILASLVILVSALWARSSFRRRREEGRKVKELVSIALERLQEQQHKHALDPIYTPHPHLRPAQLRDLTLAQTLAPAARQRLWARVQPILETNANVRVGEREVDGDSWQCWEWVGV